MINSSIGIGFNILFSILLSIKFGVLGVSLATSLSVLICAVLNIRSSHKRNHFLAWRDSLRYVPRWLIGGILCIAVSVAGSTFLAGLHPLFRFLIVVAVGFIFYAVATYPILKPFVKKLVGKSER